MYPIIVLFEDSMQRFSFGAKCRTCGKFQEPLTTSAKGKLKKIAKFSPKAQAYCNEVERFKQKFTAAGRQTGVGI